MADAEAAQAETWRERLAILTADMDNPILSLSGGNQQKALFARALGSNAQIILMDDPMRGVDVGTKREVYGIIREEAARGRTFLWYTTETDELFECDRVYVFREGAIVAELPREAVTEDKVLHASFRADSVSRVGLNPRRLRALLPALSLALILGAIFIVQPRAQSYFGLNLLLTWPCPWRWPRSRRCSSSPSTTSISRSAPSSA